MVVEVSEKDLTIPLYSPSQAGRIFNVKCVMYL